MGVSRVDHERLSVDRDADSPLPPPRKTSTLHGPEHSRGLQPGTHYVRVSRLHNDKLRRVRKGHVRATDRAFEPEAGVGRLWHRIKRTLIGRPLSTAEAAHERLPKVKALAVFASDALSSSAYAPEEVLLVLAAGG